MVISLSYDLALILPPAFLIVEDNIIAVSAVGLLQERDLIACTELDIFADVHVSLRTRLEIYVIPDTASESETYIVACLLGSGSSFCFINQRALRRHSCITMKIMIVEVIIARRIIEVHTPVYYGCKHTELELIID